MSTEMVKVLGIVTPAGPVEGLSIQLRALFYDLPPIAAQDIEKTDEQQPVRSGEQDRVREASGVAAQPDGRVDEGS